jgi:hypothetical protein
MEPSRLSVPRFAAHCEPSHILRFAFKRYKLAVRYKWLAPAAQLLKKRGVIEIWEEVPLGVANAIMSEPSTFHFWMDWGVQAVVGVGTLLVAGAAIFADAVKARFVRLSISVDNVQGTYQPYVMVMKEGEQVLAQSASIPARYYHLRVTNGSRRFPAHRTTLWLLKLELKEKDGLETWRGETPLTWQHEDFLPGPRVIGEHPSLCDLFSISSQGPGPLTMQVRNPPVGFTRTFKGACEFWVTVQARSDEGSSDEYRVHVKWDGNWEQVAERMKVEFKCRRV